MTDESTPAAYHLLRRCHLARGLQTTSAGGTETTALGSFRGTAQPDEDRVRADETRDPGTPASRARTLRTRLGAVLLLVLTVVLAGCVSFDPEGGWAAPVPSGDHVYVGTRDGRLMRVDAETGLLDPGFTSSPASADRPITIYGTPRVVEGIVYGAGYGGRGGKSAASVFAVDADTGQSVWAGGSYQLETEIVGAVAVHEDTLVFGTGAVGREDETPGYLYALDATPDAGKPLSETVVRLKWRFAVDGRVWGTPVISDGVAYFGSMDGVFHAVDVGDDNRAYDADPQARELWRFRTDGTLVAEPLVTEDRVYMGDFEGTMYAFDLAARRNDPSGLAFDPAREWRFKARGWFWSTPLLERGVLYAGTLSGRVHALDAKTGRELWPAPATIEGQIVAPMALFNKSGMQALAVPSGKEDVWVVSVTDGTSLGKFKTDSAVKAAPAAVGNLVYVHTLNDDFMAFSGGDYSRKSCVALQKGEPCQ